jgi:predicted nucleic acid-binding protein
VILLDTDVLIDLLRGYPPALEWAESLAQQKPVTTGFSALEILDGCSGRKQTDEMLDFLAQFEIVWPKERDYHRCLADFAIARLRSKIGIIDVLIGETAVGLGLPLHTFNLKHFSEIPGLRIVEPYSKRRT